MQIDKCYAAEGQLQRLHMDKCKEISLNHQSLDKEKSTIPKGDYTQKLQSQTDIHSEFQNDI